MASWVCVTSPMELSSPAPAGHLSPSFFFFLILYLFIFSVRGREGEREGEKLQSVVVSHAPLTGDLAATQACAPAGNRTSDALVHRPMLNTLSHTSQGLSPSFDPAAPLPRVRRTEGEGHRRKGPKV